MTSRKVKHVPEIKALETTVDGVKTVFFPITMAKNKVLFDIVPKDSKYAPFEIEINMTKKTILVNGKEYMHIQSIPLSKYKKLGHSTSSKITTKEYTSSKDSLKKTFVFNCIWELISSFSIFSFLVHVPATLITLFLIDPISTKKYTLLGLNALEEFSMWTRLFGTIAYNNSHVITAFLTYSIKVLGAAMTSYTGDL